jgi:hypothetical protein
MAGKFLRAVLSKPSPESTNLWGFLRALGHHWITLMSGGVITVAVALVERLTRQNVPTWVYVSILVLFALCACYLAWRDVKRKENEAVSRLKSLTRHKIKFTIDEVSTRVFVNVPSSYNVLTVTAKIKIQFENEDTYPWTMKGLSLTLHELEPPELPEIDTYIVKEEYIESASKQPMPREQFEGMLIQAGGVTPWYTCEISLVPVGANKKVSQPEDLTGSHFLRISMGASNQQPLTANLFVNWSDAATSLAHPCLASERQLSEFTNFAD